MFVASHCKNLMFCCFFLAICIANGRLSMQNSIVFPCLHFMHNYRGFIRGNSRNRDEIECLKLWERRKLVMMMKTRETKDGICNKPLRLHCFYWFSMSLTCHTENHILDLCYPMIIFWLIKIVE